MQMLLLGNGDIVDCETSPHLSEDLCFDGQDDFLLFELFLGESAVEDQVFVSHATWTGHLITQLYSDLIDGGG